MVVIIYRDDTGAGGRPAEREGLGAAWSRPAGAARGARGALGRFRRGGDRWRGRRGSGRKDPHGRGRRQCHHRAGQVARTAANSTHK